MPATIEFETERLRFVAWQERHVVPFTAMNADPEVMRYFPALVTEAQTRAAVDAWRSQLEEQGWSNWAVELKDSGEFIGFIGLSNSRRQLPFAPCVEVSWRLARRFWGHGFATEGAKACLSVGFAKLGLREIVSFTALINRPSRAVMERIGMRNTGRDFDHPAVPEDSPLCRHCLYVITQAQWVRGSALPQDQLHRNHVESLSGHHAGREAMPVGYSGTPLARKLGVRDGTNMLLINAPAQYPTLLEPLPASVSFAEKASVAIDLVHLFATRKADLQSQLAALRATLRTDAAVWVSWPKKASRVPTDILDSI